MLEKQQLQGEWRYEAAAADGRARAPGRAGSRSRARHHGLDRGACRAGLQGGPEPEDTVGSTLHWKMRVCSRRSGG